MKWFLLLLALILLSGVLLSVGISGPDHELDTVEVNRIVKTVEGSWPDALNGRLPSSRLNFDFIPAGRSVNGYVQNRDTLVDVYADGQPAGKLVFFNDYAERQDAEKSRLAVVFYALAALLALICGLFMLYQYKTILRPFKKLESFASRVAQGDLGFILEMDRKNRFGAFSESFDLMREQLAIARENERVANISKKELVASLSHDVKTPVSSIKVIAEVYQAKYGRTAEMESIIKKADQIDLLISNMFTATLEELQQLKVSPSETTSAELEEHIRASDYQRRVRPFTLPECVVTVDSLRFRQVIDNIIGNSYKYAETDIEVSGGFDGAFFTLTVRDFGPGVSSEELSLLCEKFYRAGNAKGKSGSGLGLYLSKYFLTEMGGSLTLENQNGLWAVMRLKI
ncbi:MAG: HAMP domain-containing histidine kinase [Oscillospiraceae bacterium]|jgi:signal transduction histidine kinase|nr:HAMP domain-containing histidine kinase [Oscillospiraceae bacterium]